MADSERRPLFRQRVLVPAGEPVDLRADLMRLDDLIAATPENYPGMPHLLRRRAEIADLLYGPTPALDLHLDGPGVVEHSTGGRSLGRFLTAFVDATKEVAKSIHGLKHLTSDLSVEPGLGSVRLLLTPPQRDSPPAAMATERAESVEISGIRKLVALFEVASERGDPTSAELEAALTNLHGKARASIVRLARATVDGQYEIHGRWQDPRYGAADVSLSQLAAARLRAAASQVATETTAITVRGEVDGWEWSSGTAKFLPETGRALRAAVPEELAPRVANLVASKGKTVAATFDMVTKYTAGSGEVASRGYALTAIEDTSMKTT